MLGTFVVGLERREFARDGGSKGSSALMDVLRLFRVSFCCPMRSVVCFSVASLCVYWCYVVVCFASLRLSSMRPRACLTCDTLSSSLLQKQLKILCLKHLGRRCCFYMLKTYPSVTQHRNGVSFQRDYGTRFPWIQSPRRCALRRAFASRDQRENAASVFRARFTSLNCVPGGNVKFV